MAVDKRMRFGGIANADVLIEVIYIRKWQKEEGEAGEGEAEEQ